MDKIEKIRQEIEKERKHLEIISQGGGLTEYDYGRLEAFRLIDSFVDSLQKEQPEVDLEKEIHKKVLELHTAPCYDELVSFARHFYELGLNKK